MRRTLSSSRWSRKIYNLCSTESIHLSSIRGIWRMFEIDRPIAECRTKNAMGACVPSTLEAFCAARATAPRRRCCRRACTRPAPPRPAPLHPLTPPSFVLLFLLSSHCSFDLFPFPVCLFVMGNAPAVGDALTLSRGVWWRGVAAAMAMAMAGVWLFSSIDISLGVGWDRRHPAGVRKAQEAAEVQRRA